MNSKKRILAFFLILTLLFGLMPFEIIHSEPLAFKGNQNGEALIKNASFTDIKGNANAENIMKMSVYSIIREYGSTTYKPNNYISRQDALATLVRAVGKQDEAVQQADKLKTQNTSLSSVDAYIQGHIEVAKSSGIIKKEEIDKLAVLTSAEKTAIQKEVSRAVKQNWKMTLAEKNKLTKQKTDQKIFDKTYKANATREEVALWIARALNLQPVRGEKTMSVFNYKDWKSIQTANVPFIEAVIRSGILKGATASSYMPKSNVRRGEMASVLSAVAAQSLPALEFTTGYGRVTDVQTRKDITSTVTTTTTTISMETPGTDQPMVITVQKKSGKNIKTQEAVPVLKGGKIGNESLIARHDIVEYTATKDNQMVLLHVGPYKELKGTFKLYNGQLDIIKLLDDKKKEHTMKIMPDTVVEAQKTPVETERLEEGMPIRAIYTGNTLKYMDVQVPIEKFSKQEMVVKILFADPIGRVIKIRDEEDRLDYLNLNDDAQIFINDEQHGIEAIGFDQDAVIKLAEGKVTEIHIFTDVPQEEESHTIVFTGRVRDVVGSNLFLAPDTKPDQQVSYILENNVPIIKDKKTVNKNVLRAGDKVKAYVSSADDKYITRLEVQSQGVLLEDIYRGEIKEVIEGTGEIILSNVHTYGYFDWIKKGDYGKYKLSNDIVLYSSNNRIEPAKLKDYIGKTIYAASRKDFGEEVLVQGVLKEGYEDTLYKKIKGITWTSNQLTLSDDRMVGFQNGSIIVKDGRLLDTVDLSENIGAFIIQNKTQAGQSTAPLISLESFNAFTNYRISKGYLHNMGEDYFTVESGYRLTNNTWEKWGEFIFQLNDDTHIYDNIITKGTITADKFAESRFKPYVYTWPNYGTAGYGQDFHPDDKYHSDYSNASSNYYHEHAQVYTITDEHGNTQAVNIYTKDKESQNPNPAHDERMVAGLVGTIDTANELITVKNARDYSPAYGSWQPIKVSVPMDLSTAVIIKDGNAIKIDDLTANDSIYIVSRNGYAIFAIVE